jgi:hypothetical protein
MIDNGKTGQTVDLPYIQQRGSHIRALQQA